MLNLKEKKSRNGRVIGVLDVGSSKICCVIAQIEPAAMGENNSAKPDAQSAQSAPARSHTRAAYRPRVLGIGLQRSNGLKAGVVIDLDEAEGAIRAAVSQAERMAGVQLQEVYLGVSCGRLRSLNFTAKAQVRGAVVRDDDVEQAMQGGRAFAERDGRRLVHMNAISYRLDDQPGISDPRGLAAQNLTMDVHAVTADDAPLANLMMVIERCYLSVAGIVAAPYASAIAATSAQERQMGVVCVDLGAGKTSYSIFADGHFVYTDAIAIGADHISFDISRALSTPLPEAERIKTLYGTMVSAASDSLEVIGFPVVDQGAQEGDKIAYQTTKAHLYQYVEPRVKSTLSLVMERIERSDFARFADARMVLTGGGAQMSGVADYVANRWGRPVRVSRPEAVSGVPDSVCSPAFSTVMGLLHAVIDPASGVMAFEDQNKLGLAYMGKVEKWIRESF